MKHYTRFGGLDVHRDAISPAVAMTGRVAPEAFGRIFNDEEVILRWLYRGRRALHSTCVIPLTTWMPGLRGSVVLPKRISEMGIASAGAAGAVTAGKKRM